MGCDGIYCADSKASPCRYGGIHLHADRFKHINNVARILLQETGLGIKVQLKVVRPYATASASGSLNICTFFLIAQGPCSCWWRKSQRTVKIFELIKNEA